MASPHSVAAGPALRNGASFNDSRNGSSSSSSSSSPSKSSSGVSDPHAVLPRGTRCWYTRGPGTRKLATVLTIHHDDEPPYYTVAIEGSERSTVRGYLKPLSFVEDCLAGAPPSASEGRHALEVSIAKVGPLGITLENTGFGDGLPPTTRLPPTAPPRAPPSCGSATSSRHQRSQSLRSRAGRAHHHSVRWHAQARRAEGGGRRDWGRARLWLGRARPSVLRRGRCPGAPPPPVGLPPVPPPATPCAKAHHHHYLYHDGVLPPHRRHDHDDDLLFLLLLRSGGGRLCRLRRRLPPLARRPRLASGPPPQPCVERERARRHRDLPRELERGRRGRNASAVRRAAIFRAARRHARGCAKVVEPLAAPAASGALRSFAAAWRARASLHRARHPGQDFAPAVTRHHGALAAQRLSGAAAAAAAAAAAGAGGGDGEEPAAAVAAAVAAARGGW